MRNLKPVRLLGAAALLSVSALAAWRSRHAPASASGRKPPMAKPEPSLPQTAPTPAPQKPATAPSVGGTAAAIR